MNGWTRLGIVLSIIWLLAVCGYAGYERSLLPSNFDEFNVNSQYPEDAYRISKNFKFIEVYSTFAGDTGVTYSEFSKAKTDEEKKIAGQRLAAAYKTVYGAALNDQFFYYLLLPLFPLWILAFTTVRTFKYVQNRLIKMGGFQNIKSFQFKTLNKIQKGGLSFLLIVFVVSLFLHNPFDGYTFTHEDIWTTTEPIPNKCAKAEIGLWESMQMTKGSTYDEYEKNTGLVNPWPVSEENKLIWQKNQIATEKYLHEKCILDVAHSNTRVLNLSEWKSNSPAINWFGYITHMIGMILTLIVSLSIWMFINRDQRS